MKAVITITCALVILRPCDPFGLAQEKPTPQPALTKMPAGVRELTFDIQNASKPTLAADGGCVLLARERASCAESARRF